MSITSSAPLCYGGSSGSLTAVVDSGGTAPFGFLWSNGQNTATASGLFAGTYTVTVTDWNGCTNVATATIVEPDSISCTSTVVLPLCNGGADGSITIDSTWGGTPSGGVTSIPTNVVASFCATGAPFSTFGTVSGTITIPALPSGAVINSATLVLTNMTASGSDWLSDLDVALSGVYTLAPMTPDPTNSGGVSSPTVALTGFNVTAGGSITFDFINTFGSAAATLDDACIVIDYTYPAVPSGNDPNAGYTYTWSNGMTGSSISGLAAGNYFVTVTDSIGCTNIKCIKVGEPAALICATGVTDVLCASDTNGAVDLTVSGGTIFSTPPPVPVVTPTRRL